MVRLAPLVLVENEVVKDLPARLVFAESMVWLDPLALLAQLVKLVHLASQVAPVLRVTWAALDQRVAKVCKVPVVRPENPVFPVNLALPVLPEKTVWLVTKVARVKPVLPALLVSPVLAVLPVLPEARVPLVLKDILVSLELPVSRVNRV